MNIKYRHINEVKDIAEKILKTHSTSKIFAFYGEMGVGKTTLIKSICEVLGVAETVKSPTFSIVNEYKNHYENLIYHFDFYRIKNEQEAYDLGYEDYFYSGHYCFIEWPEKIQSLLPEHFIKIEIKLTNQNRTILIESV